MPTVFEVANSFLGRLGADVITPRGRAHQTTTTRAGQALVGRVDPSVEILDPNVHGAEAYSRSCVKRYGPGFGTPWNPPGNPVPDSDNALYGWDLEEGRELPTAETLAKLGLTYPATNMTDAQDWIALSGFTRKVIQPMNRDLEPGTPPEAWPKPGSPAPAAGHTAPSGAPATTAPAAPAPKGTAEALKLLHELQTWVQGHGGKPMREVEHRVAAIIAELS